MAARELKRPVKVVYTRTQMFTGHGYRPYTWQKVALGAERDGQAHRDHPRGGAQHVDLRGVRRQHHGVRRARSTRARIVHAPLPDRATPTCPRRRWMRAPGAVSDMFALECAMDELAYALEDRSAGAAARSTTPRPTRTAASRSRARRCASATGSARRSSAGTKRNAGAALDARRAAAGRLGHGDRRLGRVAAAGAARSITLRADGTADVGSATTRHRPGHLHRDDDDRRRVPRPAAGAGEVRARRHDAAQGAVAGRLVDDRERRHGDATARRWQIGAKLLELANKDADSPLQERQPRRTWRCSTAGCGSRATRAARRFHRRR